MFERRNRSTLILLGLCAVLTGGCDGITNVPEKVELQAGMLEGLDFRIGAVETDIAELKARIEHLEFAGAASDTISMALDTGALPLTVWAGMLLVKWEDITAYGDGSRVTLRVGNPSSGTMQGLTIRASWSGDVAGSLNTEVPSTLHPGYWNRVQFRIPGVKPAQVRQLSIGLNVDTIALQQPT